MAIDSTDSEYDANGYPNISEGWLEVQYRDREALIHILWRSAMPGFAPVPEGSEDYKLLIVDAERIIEEHAGMRPSAAQVERAVAIRAIVQYVSDSGNHGLAIELDTYCAKLFGMPSPQVIVEANERFNSDGTVKEQN